VSGQPFASGLTLAVGAVLVCAVAVLWLSSLASVIRAVSLQGIALGTVAIVLGLHLHDPALIATAAVVIVVKGLAIPMLLRHVTGDQPLERETRPLVNVPASLVASAAVIFIAFARTRGIARYVGTTAGSLVPVGFAALLVGYFVLVSKRRPVFQMVGILLVDNGISLVAFLVTAGVPFLIELGVSLDVLLAVVVLGVLAVRLRTDFGDLDLDDLQELHD
jgi:hydrogenase-4 component E